MAEVVRALFLACRAWGRWAVKVLMVLRVAADSRL